MTREHDYRTRAGMFEQMAKDATSDTVRREYAKVAAEWRALADTAGGQKRTGRWG